MSQEQNSSSSLPKLRPLKGEKLFRRARRGVKINAKGLTIWADSFKRSRQSGGKKAPCVGIVVPKKVLKHATKRNRARRRIREALRTLPEGSLPACHAVIYPQPEVLNMPFSSLQEGLKKGFGILPEQLSKRKNSPSKGKK